MSDTGSHQTDIINQYHAETQILKRTIMKLDDKIQAKSARIAQLSEALRRIQMRWDIGNLNRGDTFLLHRPDYARAAQCVNAMAGVKNPAAIPQLIDAARDMSASGHPDCLDDIYKALAALDQEPT